jgi:hypothetical protein
MSPKLILALAITLTAVLADFPTPDVVFIDQHVDHFNFHTEPQTFKQRVLISDEHYDPDHGTILIYCGNEADIWIFYNNTAWVIRSKLLFYFFCKFDKVQRT